MKNALKSQKGITLMALVITIIVLLIIAGIGIGEIVGNSGDINQTEDALALSELKKIQQAVLENYIKYKQVGDEALFLGTVVDYNDAEEELRQIIQNEELKANVEDNTSENKYYKLVDEQLKKMGLENINNKDEYIVNYSTGEVFNITKKKTAKNEALYIYAKDNRQ